MRNVIVFVALSIVICGCSERGGQPQFEALARGLAEAWHPAAYDLKLEIHAEAYGERVTLRCVLQNITWKAIDVNSSELPWKNADLLSIDAVAANGKVIHRNPPPVEIVRLSGPRMPLTIAPGESMEGRIDLGAVPISGLPRSEDLLLLWSYWLSDGHSDAGYMLSGITLLKAKS
jgi:hypothetical protein